MAKTRTAANSACRAVLLATGLACLTISQALGAGPTASDLPLSSEQVAIATENGEAAARETCGGLIGASKAELEDALADGDLALVRAEARVEASVLEATTTMFDAIHTAVRAADAAGLEHYQDGEVRPLLDNVLDPLAETLRALGGQVVVTVLVSNLRDPAINADGLRDARVLTNLFLDALPRQSAALRGFYEDYAGDAAAVEEIFGDLYPLEDLLLLAPEATGRAFAAREAMLGAVMRLSADLEAYHQARAFGNAVSDCVERMKAGATQVASPSDCRQYEGAVVDEIFFDVVFRAAGLGCGGEPCFDGQNARYPTFVYDNGCFYTCITNWGADPARLDRYLEVYGQIDADGSLDGRVLINHTGTHCRAGEKQHVALWLYKMESDVELRMTGKLDRSADDGTIVGGGGKIEAPATMSAAWAEKIAGLTGEWEVVPAPDWAEERAWERD